MDNDLNLCNCGNPDIQLMILKTILQAYKDEEESYAKINSDTYKKKTIIIHKIYHKRISSINKILKNNLDEVCELLLNMLENAGLFEHGGYIGNGKITFKGEKLLLEE